MAGPLHDRAALVTGGTGALGRAVVARLLRDDADVHASWVTEREVESLKQHLGPDAHRPHFHEADLSNAGDVERLIGAVTSRSGRLDILANIAGGFAYGPLAETDHATWQKMLTLNATTAFLCTKAAVPHMRKRGWGRIVNVSAGPALERGAENMSAYAASKSAVLGLTYSLARELGRDGITVNAIVPSIIDTPANRKAMPGADTSTWLAPSAIADVVAFLVSEQSRIVTGTAVNLAKG
jgi:NAD(P)-dependent dehydrogenase (short-subunit alcohol dehydrogenase family)